MRAVIQRGARAAFLAVMVWLGASDVSAQTDDFTDWAYERLALVTAAASGPTSPAKQVETPSIAGTSTALVDRSGAPDLIGISTNVFSAASSQEDGGPSSFTVSAFAFRTAFAGSDPARPEVYAGGRHWRRFSVSVGRLEADAQPDGRLLGVKLLAVDRRDPSHPANVSRLQDALRASPAGQAVALAFDALFEAIAARLGPRLGEADPDAFGVRFLGRDTHAATLARLSEEDLAEVDRILVERLAPAMQVPVGEQQGIVQALRRAPQVAFSYQARLRQEDGDDEHLWQGIVDYGVASRVNLSINAGISRVYRALAADDTIVRLSGQAQFRLNADESGLAALLRARAPLTLSVSASAGWHRETDDMHKAQVTLTVPMPARLGGISLPISVTIANRTELVDERTVRGHVGFTLDFSPLQAALRGR